MLRPVRLLPAQPEHAPAIDAMLTAAAARDRLLVPVATQQVLEGDAWLALGDGDDLLGVGWRHDRGAVAVDVRVHPVHRRHGVGSALLEHLMARARPAPIFASCDAGHDRAQRFVRRRGFELVGVVFFQRWDGERADVPRAFQHATLRPGEAPDADWAHLQAASADAWPPPTVTAADLARADVRTRIAWVEGERAGIVVATREGDAWVAGGFAVAPAWRNRGVGRQLVCDLMGDAAAEGLGVVLRVHHEAEHIQAWTQSLGFWTYRSWAYWRHPGRGPADPVGGHSAP